MEKSKKILFSILVVTLLVLSSLSAAAMKETNNSKNIDFLALDLENSDSHDIINGFEQYQNDFSRYREALIEKINSAYQNNDATTFFETKKELANLKKPFLSQEDTEKIVKNIVTYRDSDLAMWLYKTSRYYRPSVTCTYSAAGTSFSRSFSNVPGTEIILPDFEVTSNGKIFIGWKSDDGTIYKAGDKVTVPFESLILKATFENDPNYVEGRSIKVEGLENLSIQSGEQKQITAKLMNNGTEDIEGLKISLSSDDPYLFVMLGKFSTAYFRSGNNITVSFPVTTKAPSGTQLTARLNLEDSQGDSWSHDLVITVD